MLAQSRSPMSSMQTVSCWLLRMNSTLTGRTLRELPWAYSERSAVGGSRDSQSADDAACAQNSLAIP